MYLIVTRSFPPELGGMQNLMWGLARELSKSFMVRVFADYIENHKSFDEQASFSIERVGGPKLLRKYRKAYLIDEFVKESGFLGEVIRAILMRDMGYSNPMSKFINEVVSLDMKDGKSYANFSSDDLTKLLGKKDDEK